jgi:hypothetical protein
MRFVPGVATADVLGIPIRCLPLVVLPLRFTSPKPDDARAATVGREFNMAQTWSKLPKALSDPNDGAVVRRRDRHCARMFFNLDATRHSHIDKVGHVALHRPVLSFPLRGCTTECVISELLPDMRCIGGRPIGLIRERCNLIRSQPSVHFRPTDENRLCFTNRGHCGDSGGQSGPD